MAYGRGAWWRAVGQGISRLGEIAARSQDEDRRQKLAQEDRDRQLADRTAQDMAQPGARRLADVAADEFSPETVARVANAGDETFGGPTSPISFKPPAPVTTMDAAGKPVTFQESAPFITSSGVVESPQRAREQQIAAADVTAENARTRDVRYRREDATRMGDVLKKTPGVNQEFASLVGAEVPPSIAEQVTRPRSITERMPPGLQALNVQVDNMAAQVRASQALWGQFSYYTPEQLKALPEAKRIQIDQIHAQADEDMQAQHDLLATFNKATQSWIDRNPKAAGVTVEPVVPPVYGPTRSGYQVPGASTGSGAPISGRPSPNIARVASGAVNISPSSAPAGDLTISPTGITPTAPSMPSTAPSMPMPSLAPSVPTTARTMDEGRPELTPSRTAPASMPATTRTATVAPPVGPRVPTPELDAGAAASPRAPLAPTQSTAQPFNPGGFNPIKAKAAARALELKSAGKSDQEILQTLQSEGYRVVP